MIPGVGGTSTAGQIIKADNTNLAQFDFKDMKFLGWAADTIRQTIGAPLPPVDLPDHERHIAAVRDLLSPEMFARAWAKGQAMSLDQAVLHALADTHL